MRKKGILSAALIAATVGSSMLLSGCGASSVYKKSPFLGRLSHYHRASHNPDIQQFRKKGVDLSQRKKLALEPVIFYYKRGRDGAKISEDNARMISTALTNSLADKLDKKFRLGANENNDSLVIKLALVNIIPPDSKTRIETENTKIIPVDLSKSRLEMKLMDSAAKMRPVAGLTIPVGESIPTITGGFTSWPTLEKAIDDWTTELAASIDDFSRPIKHSDDK